MPNNIIKKILISLFHGLQRVIVIAETN